MAKASVRRVISHWNKLFDGFSTSSKQFYDVVELAVERRKMPDVEISRVDWHESGILSDRREYLRVRRGKLAFDICAAPFGTGFFFSTWLAELAPPYILFFLVLLLLAVLPFNVAVLAVKLPWLGVMGAANLGFMTTLLCQLLFILAIANNWLRMEDTLRDLPYIGLVYEAIFRPLTYYQVDTITMFQSQVHDCVTKVIDTVTAAQGVRGLTEAERKPIMREFMRK